MAYIILLFLLAIILIFFEAFLPGGVLGAIGVLFLITSTSLAFQSYGIKLGFFTMFLEIICAIVSIIFAFKLMPKTKIGQELILNTQINKSISNNSELQNLIGKTGTALSDLHPSGIGEFEEQRLDIVTDGIYIEKGTEIKIVKIEGNKILVSS